MKKNKHKDIQKKSSPEQISEEDRQLFRNSVGEVSQIKKNHIVSDKNKPKPVPRQTQLDSKSVLEQLANDPFSVDEVSTGDELGFHRPGVQRQTLRKLRRGQFVIESELDLHGLTVATAKPELAHFLSYAQATGRRCVRIVHGKGHGSKNKLPVLKNKLNLWLQQRDDVLAFCSARANDGGTGAVYVLLKNKSSKK